MAPMGKNLVSKTEFGRLCGVSGGAVTKFVQGRGSGALVGPRIDLDHPAAREYRQEKTTPRPEGAAPGIDPLFEEVLAWCKHNGKWGAGTVQKQFKIGFERAKRIVGQLAAAGQVPELKQEAPVSALGSKAPPPPPAEPKPRKHGKGRKSTWEDDEALIQVPDDISELADMTLRELILKFGTGYRFYDWLRALKEIEAVNEKRIKNAQTTGKLISRQLVEDGVIDPFNSAHVRLMTDGAKAITAAVLSKHLAGVSDMEIEAYVSDLVGSFIRPVKSRVERNLSRVAVD